MDRQLRTYKKPTHIHPTPPKKTYMLGALEAHGVAGARLVRREGHAGGGLEQPDRLPDVLLGHLFGVEFGGFGGYVGVGYGGLRCEGLWMDGGRPE